MLNRFKHEKINQGDIIGILAGQHPQWGNSCVAYMDSNYLIISPFSGILVAPKGLKVSLFNGATTTT